MLVLKITIGVVLALAIWHLILTYRTQLITGTKLTWQSKYLRKWARAVAIVFSILAVLVVLINWKLSVDRERESAAAANLRKIAATKACEALSDIDLAKLYGSAKFPPLFECILSESLERDWRRPHLSLQEQLQQREIFCSQKHSPKLPRLFALPNWKECDR